MTQTSPTILRACHDSVAAREIAIEHGALTRQVAGLQRRVSEQLCAYAQQVSALEDEVLHLRAQLIVLRSSLLLGLGVAGVVKPLTRRARSLAERAETRAMVEASSVICQTGCVGHAHPWLEADGQCRRTGQACDLYAGSASEAAE
jgi:hypothetical protein